MCHHTQEPTVLSRVSCRPFHLNFDRFHQPCLLRWRNPLLPPKHGWLLGRGRWPVGFPVPRGDHLPFLGSPVLPPLRLTGGIATPTGRYHGRMLIHPSHPACATPESKGVCTHAGSGPSRVRRRLLGACLGDPIPLATPFVLASSITSFLLLTFVKFHAEFSPIFPIPCPLLLLLRESSWLEG